MLLELENVHVHYGKVEALKGISLTVDEGEIVTLIGGNGAGKTTTLKTISGIRPLSSGAIRFDGHDLAGVPATSPATCHTATSGASRSPAPSPPGPACCCSTSPRPA